MNLENMIIEMEQANGMHEEHYCVDCQQKKFCFIKGHEVFGNADYESSDLDAAVRLLKWLQKKNWLVAVR